VWYLTASAGCSNGALCWPGGHTKDVEVVEDVDEVVWVLVVVDEVVVVDVEVNVLVL